LSDYEFINVTARELVPIENINITVYYYSFVNIQKMVNIPLNISISITKFMSRDSLVNIVTRLWAGRTGNLKIVRYISGITRNTQNCHT
jgi:hypothetical protein